MKKNDLKGNIMNYLDVNKYAKPGIDTCEFEIILKENFTNVPTNVLFNEYGVKYAEIKYHYKKWKLILYLPCFIRPNNIIPFTKDDFKYLKSIYEEIDDFLWEIFEDNIIECKLVNIEVNITTYVSEGCTCDNLFNLLNHSFGQHKNQNHLYQTKSDRKKLRMGTDGLVSKIKNRWILKCYDKGKKEGLNLTRELARIEIIFRESYLKQIFKKKLELENVLQQSSLLLVLNEFNELMISEVRKRVIEYLNQVRTEIMEYSYKSSSLRDAYYEYKEIIFDDAILRKAYKRYYKQIGKIDMSRQLVYQLRAKHDIPKGTLKTLKKFFDIGRK